MQGAAAADAAATHSSTEQLEWQHRDFVDVAGNPFLRDPAGARPGCHVVQAVFIGPGRCKARLP